MCGAEEQRRVNRLDLEGLWMDIVLRGLLHAVGELVVGGLGYLPCSSIPAGG